MTRDNSSSAGNYLGTESHKKIPPYSNVDLCAHVIYFQKGQVKSWISIIKLPLWLWIISVTDASESMKALLSKSILLFYLTSLEVCLSFSNLRESQRAKNGLTDCKNDWACVGEKRLMAYLTEGIRFSMFANLPSLCHSQPSDK